MELHETKGILETHAWIKLKWTDNKLKWNISDYDNITHFHVSADEVSTNKFMYNRIVHLLRNPKNVSCF